MSGVPLPGARALTRAHSEFACWIKEITTATQSLCVSFHMTRYGESKQCLTLSAIGDNGEIAKIVSPETQSGIRIDNDLDTGRCAVDYRHRYSAKPLIGVSLVSPVSRFVRIYLSSDQPLKLQFQIPDIGIFYFFLAPKIDDV